jgi:tetratricopeptide (TPR) repeat protein
MLFRAGSVEIDAQLGCVKRDGVEQPLRQQSFQVLLFLLARRFELVLKEELVANFWHHTAVTDNALVQCIADIRRALGDDPRNPRYIKTVSRAGYRFIAEVEEVWPELPTAGPAGLHLAGLTDAMGADGVRAGVGPGARSLVALSNAAGMLTPGERGLWFESPKLRRRQFVWAIAAILVLGALVFGIMYLRSRGSDFAIPKMPGQKAVAVMYFDNLSGREDLGWLREGLADMLITDLAQSGKLTALSRHQLEMSLSRLERKGTGRIGLEEALDVARRSRAEALITGSFGVLGEEIVINVELYAVASGQLLGTDRLVMNRISDVLGQVDQTARKMATRLGAEPPNNVKTGGLAQVMTNNVEAYEAYSIGVSKARGFQNAEAIALLQKATRLDPQFTMAYAWIGYAYAVTGFQRDIGKPYLEKAIQLSDRLSEKDQLYLHAWYAIAGEDFHAAIRTLQEIIAAYPQEVEAYTRLGRLLYREERPEEALAAIRQGLAAQPEDGDLYNVLGCSFLGLHRYQDAISAHQRYVDLAPREPNSHDSLGMSYQQAGKYSEAEVEYHRALELDPGFEPALIHLGDLRAQQGQYRAAIQEYKRYIRLVQGDRPRAVAFGDLAEIYRRQGDSQGAERAAAEEIKLSKSAVWDSLLAAMSRGEVASASFLRERLFADEPYPDRGARSEMRTKAYYEGALALREGESNRAIALFVEAVKHLPPASGLDLHEDCLANAYLQLGRLDEAVAEFQRILNFNPNYPLAEYHLAQAYRAKGQGSQARVAYVKFLNQWMNADPDVAEIVDAKKALRDM